MLKNPMEAANSSAVSLAGLAQWEALACSPRLRSLASHFTADSQLAGAGGAPVAVACCAPHRLKVLLRWGMLGLVLGLAATRSLSLACEGR